jgi:hypothetical protein
MTLPPRIGKLLAVGIAAFFDSAAVLAEQSVSPITLSTDGKQFTLTVIGATRRKILEQLFVERGIEVDWLDENLAEDAIQGSFRGQMPYIARKVLASTNFVIVYDTDGEEPRMLRIIVIGRVGEDSPARKIDSLSRPGRDNH